MTPLETIWQIEDSTDRTPDQKARDIALTKANVWANLPVPMTVGSISITGVTVTDTVIELAATGGTVSWPLRLVNAPIAVPDPNGPDFDASGQGWRIDCVEVLTGILEPYQ